MSRRYVPKRDGCGGCWITLYRRCERCRNKQFTNKTIIEPAKKYGTKKMTEDSPKQSAQGKDEIEIGDKNIRSEKNNKNIQQEIHNKFGSRKFHKDDDDNVVISDFEMIKVKKNTMQKEAIKCIEKIRKGHFEVD